MLPTSALFHLAFVSKTSFLFCSWFSLNRKLTKWPHLLLWDFVHKGNLGLCQPPRPVPCCSPWAALLLPLGCGFDGRLLTLPGAVTGSTQRKCCWCLCFLRLRRHTLKGVWLITEHPGCGWYCLEPRLAEVMQREKGRKSLAMWRTHFMWPLWFSVMKANVVSWDMARRPEDWGESGLCKASLWAFESVQQTHKELLFL